METAFKETLERNSGDLDQYKQLLTEVTRQRDQYKLQAAESPDGPPVRSPRLAATASSASSRRFSFLSLAGP